MVEVTDTVPDGCAPGSRFGVRCHKRRIGSGTEGTTGTSGTTSHDE